MRIDDSPMSLRFYAQHNAEYTVGAQKIFVEQMDQ